MPGTGKGASPCVCALVLACTFCLLGDAFAQGGSWSTAERPPANPAKVTTSFAQLPLSFEANLGHTDPCVEFLSRGRGYTLFLTHSGAVLSLPNAKNKNRNSKIGLVSSASVTPSLPATGERVEESASSSLAVVRMKLVGANPAALVSALDPLPGKSNYFIGSNPAKWRTQIPHYAKVRYGQVYPGIDLIYYGHHGQLEYDFVLAPGTDPKAIRLRFEGATRLQVDEHGDIRVHATGSGNEALGGELHLLRPYVYQLVDGNRQDISAKYLLRGKNEVSFHVGPYDRSTTLIIDPVLDYSTYLGGSSDDSATGIAVDSAGSVYIVGTTSSVGFPTVGALQPALAGSSDVFVTKLNTSGTTLVYSTYLGGSSVDIGAGIATNMAGNAYVTGHTASANFPTTAGAFQSSFGGGGADSFAAKLDAQGMTLVYSTYLGGSDVDVGSALALDSAGDAYLTGVTFSTDFPVTLGAFQTVAPVFPRDNIRTNAFVTRIDPSQVGAASAVYSTYLGGTFSDVGDGIAVDSNGNAYLTGFTDSNDFPVSPGAVQPNRVGGSVDAFATKLNPAGLAVLYSTYLGGNSFDTGNAIAVDSTGNAYVTGNTPSSDFPTTPGAFQTGLAGGAGNLGDAFVTKLNTNATAFVYSTYLGGSSAEIGLGIAVDAVGNAYITGNTGSSNFPTTPDAIQSSFGGNFFLLGFGGGDAFLTKLDSTGSAVLFSSYLGGSGDETGHGIALQASANVYLTGSTTSTNFPTTLGVFQPTHAGSSDAFVAKVAFNQPPVADAGPDKTAIVGESVQFDGTGSFDPDGTIASFDWTFGDGGIANAAIVGHVYTTAGSFTATLTVTDDDGASATDTTVITVLTTSQAIQSLASLVASFNFQQGIANSLDAKLQNVLEAMNAANAGNREDAANKLMAFINAVNAQRGKEITDAQADALIALAMRILAVL